MADTTTLRMSIEDSWDVFEDHFSLIEGALTNITSEVLRLRRGLPDGFESTTWTYGPPVPAPLDLIGRMAALRKALPFAGSHVEALADLARDVHELRLEERTFGRSTMPASILSL